MLCRPVTTINAFVHNFKSMEEEIRWRHVNCDPFFHQPVDVFSNNLASFHRSTSCDNGFIFFPDEAFDPFYGDDWTAVKRIKTNAWQGHGVSRESIVNQPCNWSYHLLCVMIYCYSELFRQTMQIHTCMPQVCLGLDQVNFDFLEP